MKSLTANLTVLGLSRGWIESNVRFYEDVTVFKRKDDSILVLLLFGLLMPPMQVALAIFLTGLAITLTLDILSIPACILADTLAGMAAIFHRAYKEIRDSENPEHSKLERSRSSKVYNAVNDTFHPIKRIFKDFVDSFKPHKYSAKFELERMALQPVYGLVHIAIGLKRSIIDPLLNVGKAGFHVLSILGKPSAAGDKFVKAFLSLSQALGNLINGPLYILRGVVQLAFTPLSWTLRPLLRLGISLVADESEKPTIANNAGIQNRLKAVDDTHPQNARGYPQNTAAFWSSIQDQEQACHEIHRKFQNCKARGEDVGQGLTSESEETAYAQIQKAASKDKPSLINNYFSLFTKNMARIHEPPSFVPPPPPYAI